MPGRYACVTLDVYSALIDSRRGGTAAFAALGSRNGWDTDPGDLFVDWDRRNKALQRDRETFAPYRVLAADAMAGLYGERGLPGDPHADCEELLLTLPAWPRYPDVDAGLAALAAAGPVALASNIDDDLLAATDLGPSRPPAVTSEQASAYKPHAAFYRYVERRLGTPLLHVPASARDVRGALEAGLEVVRIVRRGHVVDPEGPQPTREITSLLDLPGILA